MEFIFGCILFGVSFSLLSGVFSRIFWDEKERRDDRKLRNY